tara:strand:+ start:520 stop:714 length:195 start_codon:yes stop_codon:yes gene_type:complete
MIKQNLYRILGLESNVDINTIKLTYRRLLSKYHPDKNQDANESKNHFIKIQDAYKQIMEMRKDG